jgi:predicted  nucleic acid-binding Zn-ribbon protein
MEHIEERDPRDARIAQLEAELAAANETMSKLASQAHGAQDELSRLRTQITEAEGSSRRALDKLVQLGIQFGEMKARAEAAPASGTVV